MKIWLGLKYLTFLAFFWSQSDQFWLLWAKNLAYLTLFRLIWSPTLHCDNRSMLWEIKPLKKYKKGDPTLRGSYGNNGNSRSLSKNFEKFKVTLLTIWKLWNTLKYRKSLKERILSTILEVKTYTISKFYFNVIENITLYLQFN